MAYRKPSDLDGFINLMPKADMRVKAILAEDLVTFLSDENNSIVCMDLGLLVDGLMPWLTGSHHKIAQKSLEAFTELIKRLGPDFNAYTATVLPHVIDRLGDSKDTVREKAQLLLHNLMEFKVLSPQQLIDKLVPCFKHKNSKVREEFLQTIVNTLNEYGTSQLSLKSYIQPIVILLGDPTSTVRDAANQTLVEIYKHVGDRLRSDLRRKEVPSTKLAILEQKFDEVKEEGLLLKSALSHNGHDEADHAAPVRPTKLIKRTVSAASKKPTCLDVTSTGDAGAVTWEIFEASFELVPQLTIFHQRDMDDQFKHINAVIGDKTMDWEKRVDALKKIRSLLLLNFQMTPYIKDMSISFLDILKELRSQVIREACITIAYMSKSLGLKVDQFCIYILAELINLIQNSAKVISSAGTIALRYVIKYTHSPKLLTIITSTLTQSKSKDIRSSLCEIMVMIFEEWQTKSLERSANVLRDTLKKSISDADNDARKHSRRAYWLFRRHFSDLADQIYESLDSATQRALERERDLMYGTNGTGGPMNKSLGGSSSSLSSMAGVGRSTHRRSTGLKSPATAPSARARKVASSTTTPQHASPEHRPAPRSRTGVSQSQPGSRSTSPSSKQRSMFGSYTSYRPTGTIPKPKASGIPRSLANSRETSPTRGATIRRNVYSTNTPRRSERPPINPGRPVLAQRMLQQSREAENALADALSPEEVDLSSDYSRLSLGRKVSRDESDESEASSVCSERSIDSFKRINDSYSWNGSRNRLDSFRAPIEDIDTIIQYCASTHWSERKDGLISLTQYLSDGKILTPQQLQCVLDMFRKMFMDNHTKVYALFLDTVNELILAHSNELHDWLFILLTRLFNKLGTELLGSMHGKIWKTLQLVHEYFPTDIQMKDVFRILSDSAQTPPTKTKIAILKFLTNLATSYCTAGDFPNQGPVEKAILKIVQLAGDQKSVELRGQARLCLIALYNCNTPYMTQILSSLPKTCQDSARTIIQTHLKRSTSGTNSPSSPLSCSSPKPLLSPSQGPFSLQNNSSPRSRQSSVENNDPLNSEEVYKSLRKTTAEIQNYSFESKLDRDTNSKDSGISQMGDHGMGGNAMHSEQFNVISSNGLNGHLLLLDKEDSCNGSKTQSATTTESNTPESTVRLDAMDMQNHKVSSVQRHHQNFQIGENGEIILENGSSESDIIKAAIVLNLDTNSEVIQQTLADLSVCIKSGNCDLPNKNFKAIMKMLLSLLESPTPEVMTSALQVLGKIVRSAEMKPFWSNFLELILLKIINCYQNSKEASREIDIIIPRIAPVLPLNISINILNPVIATGVYPLNLCAVKLLTELTEKQGNELTDIHLESIMPNLARLTDDSQSMVRKAAVFCIVKLYIVMGEDKVKPKFSLLNPSKIRLLNVYIEKNRGTKTSS
ncbi:CLIP-associating protein isoform X8 [Eupeodes corollae]|uniref:CLIP-associating protein isoform X8 n=1 Tax=Eupeodes corollae TaxID=290404 RepID=UPI002492FD9D|nr:CLIP-associating protein isoform X8 [Eupeodes corollae]